MNTVTLEALANFPHWVAWQVESRNGGKPTKVPYSPSGEKARADAPITWGTRAEAEARLPHLERPFGLGGVGIEFTELPNGLSTAGIDLDSCRDPDTGEFADWAENIIATFDTYAETSPSRTGCKLFFVVATAALPVLREAMGTTSTGKPRFGRVWKWQAAAGTDHPPAIELHLGKRYFAVTDERLPNSTTELRPVPTGRLLQLINHDGPAFLAADPAVAQDDEAEPRKPKASTDRSRSATAFRKGKQLARDGATFEAMCAALREDPDTADWMREKGDANDRREARRIFDAASAQGPLIRLRGGQLHMEATAGERAILGAGKPIFARGNGLVRPSVEIMPASKGRTTHSAGLFGVSVHALLDALCSSAVWERFDGRTNEWIEVNPPMAVAQTIMSRVGEWHFPRIAGVITTPTLRPDGSILDEPGYDTATRLYHMVDPNLNLHRAVKAPTRTDAEKALKLLSTLLIEFPFTDKVSEAVALSGLITPVVRGALSVVPLHAFTANTAGTGKSYLADLSSAISTGRPCPVASAAPDETETEKRIAGLLLAGFPITSLDNVNGELGGDLLCQAVERPLIRIRPLGRSDIIEIENHATLFATGNNLRVRGDMTRRAVVCSLDAGVERPELREFKSDPVATVMANRSLYVSACIIIVRAYAAADCPGRLKPIASFEDWSLAVRSALVWLGCEDPVRSMETAREDDPELADLREIIGLWHATLGADGYTVREVATQIGCKEESKSGEPVKYRFPDLRDALIRLFGERGEINTLRMGIWLRRHEGRIVDGLRLKRSDSKAHGGVVRWTVAAPPTKGSIS